MSTLKCSIDQGGRSRRKVLEWRTCLAYWSGRPKGNAPLVAASEALDVATQSDKKGILQNEK